MTVYISYSRRDQSAVDTLVDQLHRAGETLFLDQSLRGGEAWWSAILEQIRRCDVFVIALSNSSVQSRACRAERGYAEALGKPVLPLMIDDVDISRADTLAMVQWLDYRNPDAVAATLIDAVRRLTSLAKPLPNPLPEPPPIPHEYLARVGQVVNSDAELSAANQSALIHQLLDALRDEDDPVARDDIRQLLRGLRARPEVTYQTAARIDGALNEAASEYASRPEFNDLGPDYDRARKRPAAGGVARAVEPTAPASAFLSFSTDEDDDVASEIVNAFSNRSLGCFYAPRDVPPGGNYAKEIVRAIRSCTVLVVLLSPDALRSQHVRKEVDLALNFDKTILPFSLKGLRYPQDITTEDDWLYYLAAVQVPAYDSADQVADVVSAFAAPPTAAGA